VLAFSLSLPTTQVAVRELGPGFATLGPGRRGRAAGAGYLALRRARSRPARCCPSLLVVTVGVVIGFPLFTAIALQTTDSAHGAVIVGLLPAATASSACCARASGPRGLLGCLRRRVRGRHRLRRRTRDRACPLRQTA
jgi:drug/metabolite transporter (DMT)-like permease